MELGIGTAAGAKDIWTKSHSPGMAEFEKEWVIVPWAGASALGEEGFRCRRTASRSWKLTMEEHSQDFTSAWFIVSGQSWVGFSLVSSSWSTSSRVSILGTPVQTELLEIPSQRVHQATLVAVELA